MAMGALVRTEPVAIIHQVEIELLKKMQQAL